MRSTRAPVKPGLFCQDTRSMKLRDKLEVVFECARKINNALWMSGIDSQYVRIDQLRAHIAETYGVEIDLEVVDVENDHVLGFIERYEGGRRARVYLVKNMGPRQKRLVATKELCHIAIDSEEDFSTDAMDTLERMVTFGLDQDAPENAAVRSEVLAELVAWELLYPHENRRADKDGVLRGDIQLSTLAQRYQIPEHAIEMILRAPYLEMCDKYWALVHANHQAILMAQKSSAA